MCPKIKDGVSLCSPFDDTKKRAINEPTRMRHFQRNFDPMVESVFFKRLPNCQWRKKERKLSPTTVTLNRSFQGKLLTKISGKGYFGKRQFRGYLKITLIILRRKVSSNLRNNKVHLVFFNNSCDLIKSPNHFEPTIYCSGGGRVDLRAMPLGLPNVFTYVQFWIGF
jgi:hypothetical protein